jgi:hypothetical protein
MQFDQFECLISATSIVRQQRPPILAPKRKFMAQMRPVNQEIFWKNLS